MPYTQCSLTGHAVYSAPFACRKVDDPKLLQYVGCPSTLPEASEELHAVTRLSSSTMQPLFASLVPFPVSGSHRSIHIPGAGSKDGGVSRGMDGQPDQMVQRDGLQRSLARGTRNVMSASRRDTKIPGAEAPRA